MRTSPRPNFFIFRASLVPKFPFDEDYRYEEDWSEDGCSNCGEPLQEHTQRQLIRCALERVGGIPH